MRIAFDRFTLDADTRELLEQGRRIHLSPKAFDLLHLLLQRRPAVVSKDEIHDRVWQGAFVGDANFTVVVAEIRQALGDDARESKFIRTVHRVGYAFSGAAREVSGSAGSGDAAYHRCWLTWNEQHFPLAEGGNVIGRDPRCAVWLDASGVSRRHAEIAVSVEGAAIEDLGSRNGTFVDGRRVTASQRLHDGEVLELGTAVLTFRMWSDDPAQKTERIARRRR